MVESGSERGKERVEGGGTQQIDYGITGTKNKRNRKNRENSSWLVHLDNWFTLFF